MYGIPICIREMTLGKPIPTAASDQHKDWGALQLQLINRCVVGIHNPGISTEGGDPLKDYLIGSNYASSTYCCHNCFCLLKPTLKLPDQFSLHTCFFTHLQLHLKKITLTLLIVFVSSSLGLNYDGIPFWNPVESTV